MGSSATWEAKEKFEFCGLLHGARSIENTEDYFLFECRSKMILKSGTVLCKIVYFGFLLLLIKIQNQNKYVVIKSLSEVLFLVFFFHFERKEGEIKYSIY